MGHTNYWSRIAELPVKEFAAAVKDCKKMMKQLGVPLAGRDGTGPAIFRAQEIAFNGQAPNNYETFSVPRAITPRTGESKSFQFCKTAHRPYDLCVQVALIVLKHHLGKAIEVSSDGEEADWEPARIACQKWLGYGGDFRLEG
ncbi:MAG: hypothetical protein WCI73_00125 [Phycisphaerae bacterium]